MCPDKPPSCYPTPTLGESGSERFDRHPWNQSASGVQIVVRPRARFLCDWPTGTTRTACRRNKNLPRQYPPSSTPSRAPIGWPRSCGRSQPKDPAKRKLDKQRHGEPARGRAHRPAATGLHHRRGGREPARARPRHHDADAQELPQRAKSKTEKRAKSGARTASSGSGSGTPKTAKREASNAPAPATTQTPPAAKQAASTPEAGAAPEATALRSGKGAFLVKDKDSY